MDAVLFEQVGYRYPGGGGTALRNVSLTVNGGVTLLTGDSGSGKSTLLRLCNGLVPHFHGGVIDGTAVVFGQHVTRTNTRTLARDVGFVFQDPELQAVHARVDRDVAFGLENQRVPRAAMQARVDEALHVCGIDALRSRAVATLSGGERQRVALAGVLAMQPRLLVLDEPLSQLDGRGAAGLVAALGTATHHGTSALVAEHRLSLLSSVVERRLEMSAGELGERDRTIDRDPLIRAAHADATASGEETPVHRASGVRLRRVTAGHAGVGVLHDVDLTVAGGEVLAVVGDNGSGKTTLLRTIAGVLPPLHGVVERDPGRVAYLPQNPTVLLHRQTLHAEIAWTLQHDATGTTTESVLHDFGLAHVAERYPRDLSTGERQRAALAAVLAGAPSLALLDEPTRGMDNAAALHLMRAVRRLVAAGAAVVIATHDRGLAESLATRVVETRDSLLREPARTMVAS